MTAVKKCPRSTWATWGDAGGPCKPVTVELWAHDTVRFVAAVRHEGGYLQGIGFLFIDYMPEAALMARLAIDGALPPPVLADWIEEHPECWRCPGEIRDAAVREICERLRAS